MKLVNIFAVTMLVAASAMSFAGTTTVSGAEIYRMEVSSPNLVASTTDLVFSSASYIDTGVLDTIMVETSDLGLNCALPAGFTTPTAVVIYDPNALTTTTETIPERDFQSTFAYLSTVIASDKSASLTVYQDNVTSYCYIRGVGLEQDHTHP